MPVQLRNDGGDILVRTITFPNGLVRDIPECSPPARNDAPRVVQGVERIKRTRPKMGLLRTYEQAVKTWVAAGSPTRSQEEIDAILAICNSCEHFRKGKLRNSCAVCGCSLNRFPNGLVNKIAMATECCPLAEPKWTATA